jgi:regulator of sirC expression with transglutaminase-like and TPR domain
MNLTCLRLLLFICPLFSMGCRIEKPDPVSAANAIIHKHPSDFLDQLTALDALAAEQAGLPKAPWMDILYSQSSQLKSSLKSAVSDSAKVAILNAWIFDSLGLSADPDSNGLSNSLPSQVIANKRGSALGLTMVYLVLGQTMQLPLVPVLMPGHIFIRYQSNSYTCNIETLRRGSAESDSFYQARYFLSKRPWYKLAPGNPEQALCALLFSLANHHFSQGKWAFALGEYQLVLGALPGFPEALIQEGNTLLNIHDPKTAEDRFQTAFKGDSLSQIEKKK